MNVKKQRRVRRRKVYMSVRFGEFLQFSADVGLPVTPDVLVVRDVEAREVEVASRAGYVKAC